ncbi:MAG TPA: LamG domain-containing protein [Verrucomicrobiae bacterium]|nr:LamG domain-containing protein [Verrucomicrobiae bacterium]
MGPNTDWGVALTGNAVAFGIGGGSTGTNVTITSSPVNDGEWRHIVATWEASNRQMHIYLDGQPNVTGVSASGEPRLAASPLIVARCSTANRFYAGLLDDIQIYNRALSANDVSFLFNAPGLTVQ